MLLGKKSPFFKCIKHCEISRDLLRLFAAGPAKREAGGTRTNGCQATCEDCSSCNRSGGRGEADQETQLLARLIRCHETGLNGERHVHSRRLLRWLDRFGRSRFNFIKIASTFSTLRP